MKKKLISLITAMVLSVSLLPAANAAAADTNNLVRIMERLDRGLVAVKVDNGVYLSWRLLGTESLENQAFDIYKNDRLLIRTGVHDATCYTDVRGTVNDEYKVVLAGAGAEDEKGVKPWDTNAVSNDENSEYNSLAYMDVPIVKPVGGTARKDTSSSTDYIDYEYTANDASVGDLDGDGEYEIVLKWDPSNSEDSGKWNGNYTGNVYIDGYRMNTDNKNYMWRIDLGPNIRAGAHYTQFIVYDLNGDGKAEIAMKTAPGSKDGQGKYVTLAGDTDEIKKADNSIDYRDAKYGGSLGRIYKGPEYLTVFDGETGEAICTTNYIPRGSVSDWGDNGANRSERYLAGVAYLDGVHPSLIMTRGYYMKAVACAYTFDGKNINKIWECNGNLAGADSLYGQGNHSLSISDIDNDGLDEIVYGSASIDDDGKVIGNTQLGHGDALHVSDFNNDGIQEAFSVKEDKPYLLTNGGDFRVAKTGENIFKLAAEKDVGRGIMANVDDDYASTHPDALALAWTSENPTYDTKGNLISENKPGVKIGENYNAYYNFAVYWDGDLGRELLDKNIMIKYSVANDSSKRFYTGSSGYTFNGIHTNNSTKENMSLVADIFGDWREEIMAPLSDDSALRIFMSTIPTTYRLTTLMHDSQYRTAIAWQNVGYNQPPHTSYYIGSAALAKNGSTALNYLAPAVPFTVMTYPGDEEGPAPTPPAKTTTTTIRKTATKVRNEIGSSVNKSNIPEGTVKLHSYNQYWGAAYFGFEGIEGLNTAIVSGAEIDFSAHSYNSGNRSRQFYFDLFHTNNNWEAGTVVVSKDPHPSASDNLISRTSCKTNNAQGEILAVGGTRAFDITDYVKTLDNSTRELSFITAVSGDGSSGAGAADLNLYNNPTLIITMTETTNLTSISAATQKNVCAYGEDFTKTDVEVTAHYDDGTEMVLTPYYYTISGYDKEKSGAQTVTVHCGAMTAEVNVTVGEKPRTDTYINKTEDTLSVTNGTLTGTVSTRLENYSGAAVMVLAVYDNEGELRYLDIKNTREAVFGNINASDISAYRYTVFAWKGIDGAEPICEAYVSQ